MAKDKIVVMLTRSEAIWICIVACCFACAFGFVVGYVLKSEVDYRRDPSIVTIKVERKPSFNTSFFVVDSSGVPVPNARIGLLSNSGWTYSKTNEFGYSDHDWGENEILSLTVNEKVILKKKGWWYSWYGDISRLVFLIRIDD